MALGVYIYAASFLPRLALPNTIIGVSLIKATALVEAAGLTLRSLRPGDSICDLPNHHLLAEAVPKLNAAV